MERPEIKDKKALEYVQWMEKQLANYRSEKTVAKSYLGLKNIVDQMNTIMNNTRLIVEEVDEEGKSEEEIKMLYKEQRKQQQILEKSLEVSDRIEEYTMTLERMEKKVNADVLMEVSKEPEPGSIYEESLKLSSENK